LFDVTFNGLSIRIIHVSMLSEN